MQLRIDLSSLRLSLIVDTIKPKILFLIVFITITSGLNACTDSPGESENILMVNDLSNPTANVPSECIGQAVCQGSLALYCVGSVDEVAINCNDFGGICVAGRGCTICEPNTNRCNGLELYACSADGLSESLVQTCESECYAGECTDPCARAAQEKSYQGCEYWPTPVSNSINPDFSFAIGVVNVNEVSASISIRKGNESIFQGTVRPGALEVIELPWINDLTYQATINDNYVQGSTLVRDGAYQINTDLPVTVYQFNPLEYRLDNNCSADDQDLSDGACFSYSNDASLLLPVHALDRDYIVLSYPSLALSQSGQLITNPSTFQIVAVTPGTTEIDLEFSANTSASHQGSLRAFQAGEQTTLSLNQGEVLQFAATAVSTCRNPSPANAMVSYCEVGAEGDLSGTFVKADKAIQVFGSHTCAFVPYNVFACDHLEESIFPLSTWGKKAVVTKLQALLDEPTLIRVTSGSDQNEIRFKPESTYSRVTLDKGETIEFYSNQGFTVSGTDILQLTQFLVGQNYSSQSTRNGFGDPAMSLIPPADQFRKDYTILAPESYALHYLNLAIPRGEEVTLDGQVVSSGERIGDGSWEQVTVEVNGGVHRLESTSAFGVWVYGFGNYTSYMYPGGLDLKVINDISFTF